MSDLKHKYSKKDLQKLEMAGVKIVVVPDTGVAQDAAAVTDASGTITTFPTAIRRVNNLQL